MFENSFFIHSYTLNDFSRDKYFHHNSSSILTFYQIDP
jgi:hypothetical protein